MRARFLRRLRSALLRYVFGLVVRDGSGARSVSRSSRATASVDGGCARAVAWSSPCARFFDFFDDDDGVARGACGVDAGAWATRDDGQVYHRDQATDDVARQCGGRRRGTGRETLDDDDDDE